MDRCPWAKTDLYVHYHDTEWGVPVSNSRQAVPLKETLFPGDL
jgi:3-methyladenine DNA glycosylase Tag